VRWILLASFRSDSQKLKRGISVITMDVSIVERPRSATGLLIALKIIQDLGPKVDSRRRSRRT
jgi:hypothetical protein